MRRLLSLFPLLTALAFAGCSSVPINFDPKPISFGKHNAPLMPGKLGIAQITDNRVLPFHVQYWEDDDDYFGNSAISEMRETLARVLRNGYAFSQVVEIAEPSLKTPTPEQLFALGARNPGVDYLLCSSVEVLNITNQDMATMPVQVGTQSYNITYYSQRFRIRMHLELYSLKYGQLLWADVIEGLGHAEQSKNATQLICSRAINRFCEALQASLVNSATKVKKDQNNIELATPSQDGVIQAAVSKAKRRYFGVAEDYREVHNDGIRYVQEQAQAKWNKQMARQQLAAGLAQTGMALQQIQVQQQGGDMAAFEQYKNQYLQTFKSNIEALGVNTGSHILNFDVPKLKAKLVNIATIGVDDTGKTYDLLGETFSYYRTDHFDILTQVSTAESKQMGIAAEGVFQAYLKTYGHRNNVAEKMKDPRNKMIIFICKDRKAYKRWVAKWNKNSVNAGGFRWQVPASNPCMRELNNNGFGQSRRVAVQYWQGHVDRISGKPISGLHTLWEVVPHEMGHDVHAHLLSENFPDVQSDGFAQHHEWPVTFAGDIGFGQWATPTNWDYLQELQREDPIPFEKALFMPYKELSNGGQNHKGYFTMWLYYEYMQRTMPEKLQAFEDDLAKMPKYAKYRDKGYAGKMKKLFMKHFGLQNDADIKQFGQDAIAWMKRQKITKQDLERSYQAYEAVSQMKPKSYNQSLRKMAVQPE